MKPLWTEDAWADYLWWQSRDKRTLRRINMLIRDIMRSPFDGIGKPEPLKWDFQGAWSRRIGSTDRLIYTTTDEGVCILSCKDHHV